jgi:diguanylate cyclase (GGDEF)-like protein/PAS domain S-box-containing protein
MLQRGSPKIGVQLLHGLRAVFRRLARKRNLPDAHYKALIDQATDGILLVGCKDGRVLYVNAALSERLGHPSADAAQLALRDIFADADVSVASLVAKFAGVGADRPVLLQQRAKGQECIDVEVRFYALQDDGRDAYAFILRDVSVRNKVEQQLIENQQRLDRMAHHDQLTGLPNRHYLHAFLPDAIESAKTSATMLGVVFLDLDRFKHINDTRGHETGDKLLQEVARRVRTCVRDSDVVIRMGGDEFVIVLRNVKTFDEISHGAGRIVATLNKPIFVDGHPLQTTASVGVSIFPRDGANMMDLLKHSDTAMYQAKDRGRNNVQIFSAIMNRKLEHRVAVEAALRDALRLKQLDVHYQPFVNLRSKKIVGLEALVRWRHPVEGMIPPDRFIPVAEETGLVVPIGNFVLHRTLQNMSAWKRAGVKLVPVSLNVSPAQLQRGELRSLIATLLATYDLPAELLQLELTERAVFDLSVPQAGENRRDSIAQVRDLGVKIAIDDFGTGYSSLSYLKHWQVDSLKIDKSFVRDLATDSSDLAIVSAIIAIAKHLRIEVVGEGIEGYQQAEILRNLGCHLGQGYLFARPVPADECVALLRPQLASVPIEEEEFDMLAALKIANR